MLNGEEAGRWCHWMVSLDGVIGGFVGGRLLSCGRESTRAAVILVATMQCVSGGVYLVGLSLVCGVERKQGDAVI